MKKYLATLMFVLAMGFVHGQSASQEDVAAAVDRLYKAMIAADKNGLKNLTVDSLSYGHSSGVVENREQFVDAIVSGKSAWLSVDLSAQTVTVNGKTAIVRHILKARINDSGKPGEVNLRIMQVWQKVKGGWKMFGRQAVKMT